MRKKATFSQDEMRLIDKAARSGFPVETAIAGLPSHSSHAVRSLFGRLKASAIRERNIELRLNICSLAARAPVVARVPDTENPDYLNRVIYTDLTQRCCNLLKAQERVYGVWPGKAAMLARAVADTAASAR